ncbi:MAG: hypothetical protein DWQ37_07120 [Planctomycetota bacterium]|nr:MAG: hypothetical protein DWQ37_07120 [Planctomycetota bacterium]
MSRMLDALRTLEARKRRETVPPPEAVAAEIAPAPLEHDEPEIEALLDEISDGLAEELGEPKPQQQQAEPTASPRIVEPAQPQAPFETCVLPIVPEPDEAYLQMAERIGEQLSVNYSNVVAFVTAGHEVERQFSMTQLAQAFSQQMIGDVLLIDGDLRAGRLSKSIARRGPGMIEAMLGKTPWPDIIHPTNLPRIDFVARGLAQVPTLERSEFGWAALRPMYRFVLIGPADAGEPETQWLASRCDAVYYVLSRRHTRRSLATATVHALRSAGANVAGAIVADD